jgi:hypothetical protein
MRAVKMIKLGCVLALGLGSAMSAAPALSQQSVEARLATYRDRVARLEDQAAVENLTATFGFYFDKGLWNEAASLFSRNGSFEYEQRGVYVGPQRIERAMLLFGPQGLADGYLNNHMMLQNIIVVAPDGKTATGRWQGPVQLSRPNATGQWAVGLYENTYVKEGGVWKIASLHFYLTAKTDYDQGWAKSLLPMEGPSALFPPDRPPSEAYRALPAAYLPPFSFDHPVTGESLKGLPMAADDVTGRAEVKKGQ